MMVSPISERASANNISVETYLQSGFSNTSIGSKGQLIYNTRLTNAYGPPQAENFGVLKPLSPFGNTFLEGFRAFQKSKNPPKNKKISHRPTL